jgi:hypothetical protein
MLVSIVVVIIIFASPCFIIIVITLLLVIVLVLSLHNGKTLFPQHCSSYNQSIKYGTVDNVRLERFGNHRHEADQSVTLAAPTETTPSPVVYMCNIPWLSIHGLLRDLPGTVEIVLSCLSSVQ